jgi:hypothetical protein
MIRAKERLGSPFILVQTVSSGVTYSRNNATAEDETYTDVVVCLSPGLNSNS